MPTPLIVLAVGVILAILLAQFVNGTLALIVGVVLVIYFGWWVFQQSGARQP